MVESRFLEPVTLQSLPTCQNCVTWTDEYIAIAGGEVVHILSPSDLMDVEKPQRGYWHIDTVRVNQFEEHEWPIPELAPLREFSLGEEQSNSAIVALAWSSEGLGMHKRNVLAVLTSNLLLSLWESNGLAGTWKRTCVINHFLKSFGEKQRLKNRVRAFKWLPPLKMRQTQRKWGLHYILVADDNSTVSLLQIDKGKPSTFGHWKVEVITQYKVPVPQSQPEGGVLFLRSLLESGSISTFKHGDWQEELGNDTDTEERWFLPLMCYRGPSTAIMNHHEHYFQLLCIVATNDTFEHTSESTSFVAATASDPKPDNTDPITNADGEIAKPRAEFNKQHNLKGRVRIRKWGSAYCQKYSSTATCVSFHPSDMIEYIIPSMERCTVVFTPPQIEVESPESTSLLTVLEQVAKFVKVHAHKDSTTSLIDQRLVQTIVAIRRAVMKQVVGSASPSNSMNSSEQCQVCGTNIPITTEISIGRCLKGHTFTRCGLSFLTIQKPGISKYCSRCGKQFLNTAKLDPVEGPSLMQAMFEEFDVCAYCQGKFRG